MVMVPHQAVLFLDCSEGYLERVKAFDQRQHMVPEDSNLLIGRGDIEWPTSGRALVRWEDGNISLKNEWLCQELVSLTRPVSMTATISSIVMEVSAMFVAAESHRKWGSHRK